MYFRPFLPGLNYLIGGINLKAMQSIMYISANPDVKINPLKCIICSLQRDRMF